METSMTLVSLIDRIYDILGAETKYTVYGKSPTNTTLEYPCIVIRYDNNHTRRADNGVYMKRKKYTLTVITKDIFDTTHDLLEEKLPYCRVENTFISDDLYHYKLVLYY